MEENGTRSGSLQEKTSAGDISRAKALSVLHQVADQRGFTGSKKAGDDGNRKL